MAKKERQPSDIYLSDFCYELALMLKAGITVADCLDTLKDDDDVSSKFVVSLAELTADGKSLTDALEQIGYAPKYMVDMVRLGERSGKLEETLFALSKQYKRQDELNSAVSSAVLYPVTIIIILAAVVILLATRVLPIFADVYSQLGAEMSPLANSMLKFGQNISIASSVLIWVLAIIAIVGGMIYAIPPARQGTSAFFRKHFGGNGAFADVVTARFSNAMATAVASGINPEEAVMLAGEIVAGINKTDDGIAECRRMLEDNEPLEKALSKSGIFSKRECKLLSLGVKVGSIDEAMEKISSRAEEKAINGIDRYLGRIEPILVIIVSTIIAAVLISVLLPLMGIMSSVG